MVWNGMKDFSIFHTGSFLPLHFYSILKIFHSIFHFILKFSSIFHSILPYQDKFRPKATRSLCCTFAMLSVTLQVVAREGKQYGKMHLIWYWKHFRNVLRATTKIPSTWKYQPRNEQTIGLPVCIAEFNDCKFVITPTKTFVIVKLPKTCY